MKKPIHVLLVEDNPGDADLTRETLEEGNVPMTVSVVTDGAAAVDYVLGRGPYSSVDEPDLIVLDLNLPKMDGREVLAEIRRHDGVRKIPVVVLTSSDAEQDVVKSYELGANCYVTKPVGLVAYQSLVRSVETFWFSVVKLP